MGAKRSLLTSSAGITHTWEDDGKGGGLITASADVAPIIEANKVAATTNDGYSPSRELRRVATIPAMVRMKWLVEEGWDCFAPENADRLRKRLDDPDWAFLRTDNRQRLGPTGDGGFR